MKRVCCHREAPSGAVAISNSRHRDCFAALAMTTEPSRRGSLSISFFDNPAGMSLHEEPTGAALRPMMGVFNNLVMYDQHVAQRRLAQR
jgi:hypothetical protein